MIEEIEEQGLWWLPDNIEDKVSGTLRFDQKTGVRLELIGMLSQLEGHFTAPKSTLTIHGLTTGGKEVSLLHAFQRTSTMRFPGIPVEEFFANIALVGAHICADGDQRFDRSYCRFEQMEQWIGIDPFVETISWDPYEASVSVRHTEPIELGRGEDWAVLTSREVKTGRRGSTEWRAVVEQWLSVRSDDLQSLDWHWRKAGGLRELASLCLGDDVRLTGLKLRLPGDGEANSAEVTVLAQLTGSSEPSTQNVGDPMWNIQSLLTINPHVIADWFDQRAELKESMNLFFTALGRQWMYLNARFLSTVQGIEVFARVTQPPKLVGDDEYELVRDVIIAALPDDMNQSLKEKLVGSFAFANEPNLRQRLKTLISGLSDERAGNIEVFDKAWVNSIVDTRNYLTHYTTNLAGRALRGADMYWATRRMLLLMTVLFFRRLKLPITDIESALARHREFGKLWLRKGSPV